MLCSIYALSLYRKTYILVQARKEEADALRSLKNHLENPSIKILEKIPHWKKNYDRQTKILLKKYQHYHKKRLTAERNVSFNIVEVVGSSLVVSGTFLSTALIVGAGIASLGILPITLLLSGVAIGLLGKIFENRNAAKNYVYTDRMRNWFAKHFSSQNNVHLKPKINLEHKNILACTKSHTISPRTHQAISNDPRLSKSARRKAHIKLFHPHNRLPKENCVIVRKTAKMR